MSWAFVRPYFEEILREREYREWEDSFGTDVAAGVMDKAFHVGVSRMTGRKQNQQDQETEIQVELRTWHVGYGKPVDALDEAIAESQAIMQECVKPSRRVQTPGLLNVVFNEAGVEPLAANNDNAVMVTASYTVRVIVAV